MSRLGENDKVYGPLTVSNSPYSTLWGINYNAYTDDDDERDSSYNLKVGCNDIVVHLGKYLSLRLMLPYTVKTHNVKVTPNWDKATIERLGRDYYYNRYSKKYGFIYLDTSVLVRYGVDSDSPDIDNKTRIYDVPWLVDTYYGFKLYTPTGELYYTSSNEGSREANRDNERLAVDSCPKTTFKVKDYDGEIIEVETYRRVMIWKKGSGICSWLKYILPDMVRDSLELTFSTGVGKRKESWKGGLIGMGFTIEGNETPLETMRRFCLSTQQNKHRDLNLTLIE